MSFDVVIDSESTKWTTDALFALVVAGALAAALSLVRPVRREIVPRSAHVVQAQILLSIVGAACAMYLQRYFIIVGTSFGGAWTLLVGALALIGDARAMRAAASGDVWVAYPLDPAPGQRWLPVAWIALSLIGAAVQLGITGGERGRVVKRRRKKV